MLQHVTLEVRPDQVDPCVRFWALLGFEWMLAPPLLRDRFTWVAREGTQIHLVPVEPPIVPDQGHVAVLPEDYEATLAALRDAGYELTAGATRGTRRGRSCAAPRGTASRSCRRPRTRRGPARISSLRR